MKRKDFELLGDKHKAFEARTETKLLSGCPVVIRLDGRAFHTFTRGMERPFDQKMTDCMIETTRYLVGATKADVGYAQSDEINLVFKNNKEESEFMFSGRVQKICSIVASMTSVKFNQLVTIFMPERSRLMPIFDARVFQYPTLELAAESLLWRETDATRNSLSMAVQSCYSHNECMGKGFVAKHDMLHAKGINWNDYPSSFKRGIYLAKKLIQKTLSHEELSKIPEKHREPDKIYTRSEICVLELPEFTKIENPVQTFFGV